MGPRTELLDGELEKLSVYADGAPIQADVVRLLVPEARAANVFELGDHLVAGDRTKALALLERLSREGEYPLKTLQLVVRHFRLLVEAQVCAEPQEFAKRSSLPEWVAEKTWWQARNVAADRLRSAFATLLAADAAIKQSRSDPETVLLLAVLCLSDPRSAAGRSHWTAGGSDVRR